MRIDLAGERGQARFIQTELLGFEFFLVARVVPDFERDDDGEDGAEADGNAGGEVGAAPDVRHEDSGAREDAGGSHAQQFHGDDGEEAAELEEDAELVLALAPAFGAEADEQRESPDVFFFGSNVAEESAEDADAGEERHGHQLTVEDGGDGDEDAGEQSADVAADHAGGETAFEAEINGLVAGVQYAQQDAGAVRRGEAEGKFDALEQGALFAHKHALEGGEAGEDAGERGSDGDAEEEGGEMLRVEHLGSL